MEEIIKTPHPRLTNMSIRYTSYKLHITTGYTILELFAVAACFNSLTYQQSTQPAALTALTIAILYLAGYYQNMDKRSWFHDMIKMAIHIPLGMVLAYAILLAFSPETLTLNTLNNILATTSILVVVLACLRLLLYRILKRCFNEGILHHHILIVTTLTRHQNNLTKLKINPQRHNITFLFVEHPSQKAENNRVIEAVDEIKKGNIDEIIWSLPEQDWSIMPEVLHTAIEHGVQIKQVPNDTLIALGLTQLHRLTDNIFLQYDKKSLKPWEAISKRTLDIVLSFCGIAVTIPFLPWIAWSIKSTSKGPVFYCQERIGKKGKPFNIIKFRSMYLDAEKDGPALSSAFDQRITKAGRILRKWRIDEFPQFINVLLGQMSIVGPRPERAYYIGIITKEVPHFTNYLTVKPGITSLGMVKFGYAENPSEMINRFRYDLFYIQNQSFFFDIKIMALTIRTLFLGNGK